MRAVLEQIIARYGQTVTRIPRDGGEAQEIRAFLQPILKEQSEPPVAVTPLGPVSKQRWLYIGQAGVEAAVGDQIACSGTWLAVQEVQTVYWRNEALYQRAILQREKEAAG